MNKGLRLDILIITVVAYYQVRRSDLMNKGLRPFICSSSTGLPKVRRSDLMNKGFVEGFGNTEYRRQESE